MEAYLLAWIGFILVVSLTELVGLRKDLEEQESEAKDWMRRFRNNRDELKEADQYSTELENTNRALKWANTKHKATIKGLESKIDDYERNNNTSIQELKEQADTIKRLNEFADESFIAINAVGNESNKKKRLEQLDKYMNKA
mgnify:CR=1 FL=1